MDTIEVFKLLLQESGADESDIIDKLDHITTQHGYRHWVEFIEDRQMEIYNQNKCQLYMYDELDDGSLSILETLQKHKKLEKLAAKYKVSLRWLKTLLARKTILKRDKKKLASLISKTSKDPEFKKLLQSTDF